MKVVQTVCEECKKVKGEDNHWFKMGALRLAEGGVTQLTLGNVPEKEMPGFELHDLCGPTCFHIHIDKILGIKFTPPALLATTEVPNPAENTIGVICTCGHRKSVHKGCPLMLCGVIGCGCEDFKLDL